MTVDWAAVATGSLSLALAKDVDASWDSGDGAVCYQNDWPFSVVGLYSVMTRNFIVEHYRTPAVGP